MCLNHWLCIWKINCMVVGLLYKIPVFIYFKFKYFKSTVKKIRRVSSTMIYLWFNLLKVFKDIKIFNIIVLGLTMQNTYYIFKVLETCNEIQYVIRSIPMVYWLILTYWFIQVLFYPVRFEEDRIKRYNSFDDSQNN